jgi:diaminohydroxyphosphoribosylaminopyrimidine deaminase / 5-amino-6-(5-phosphoribosylamino)uracil reductase
MIEADMVFMKRALALARRGAGLVSPNPMVGALLVKQGRVLGEGFHRYDLFKHAETYAIEMAGQEARGATLYCNLEPCCHHGRTPPCTDALIEAGISRAVIATKDPFAKVNGRGIEQLRAAGVDVEAGLCGDEALRLNESYFKFVTRGAPFVHGVIEYAGSQPWTATTWNPSREFVTAASEYDAIVLGARDDLNTLLIEQRLGEKHHRPFVVVGPPEALDSQVAVLGETNDESAIVIRLSPGAEGAPDVPSLRREDAEGSNIASIKGAPVPQELSSVLEALARIRVTSVLLLPGVFDPSEPKNFEQLDKLSLVAPSAKGEDGVSTHLAFADLEFDLEQVSVVEIEQYTEFTGYPSFRGVA